jgi:tetratricopeptide (TPR) repeat protein
MDAEIEKADKSGDKKALSQAYLKRADALTQARQYAAALGDYRKALKADPSNADAKNWIDQITMVYQSMNREAPKEGEEPGPLPFKKP